MRDLELGGGRPTVLATVEFSAGTLFRVQCEPYETWWWRCNWDRLQVGRVHPWLRMGGRVAMRASRVRSVLLDANVRFSDWRRLFVEMHDGPKLQIKDGGMQGSRCVTSEKLSGQSLVFEWKLHRIQQVGSNRNAGVCA